MVDAVNMTSLEINDNIIIGMDQQKFSAKVKDSTLCLLILRFLSSSLVSSGDDGSLTIV